MEQATTSAGARTPALSVNVVALVFAGVAIVALVLPQWIGLGASAVQVGFFALGLAAAAIIASFACKPSAGETPVVRGLALAATTISAAFFLGLSGAVYAWGQDGLAFVLGLGAGYLLQGVPLELAAAYALVRDRGGFSSLPRANELQLALSYFLARNMLALQADYGRLWGAAGFAHGSDRVRVQLQVVL